MTNLGVGKEVLSYCNKCKLTLAHIIAVMKDSTQPDKVQCLTCKATHKFKDPNAVKVKKVTTRSKGKSTRKNTVPLADQWTEAMNNSSAPTQKYSIKNSFVKGDIISHPKFGDGIVERVLDKTKIEVMFKNDIKTLVHNIP